MKTSNGLFKIIIIIGIISITSIICVAEQVQNDTWKKLTGKTDFSRKWGSGWLDLDIITDFKEGDKLKLKIGGTAKIVLVRLLPKTSFPETSDGVVGKFDVSENRTVVVNLECDRPAIKQVSVHGGPNPWGEYPLEEANGNATLKKVQLKQRKKSKK